MSKDIIIEKNGVEQEFEAVDAITTADFTRWVPEDERQLMDKIVTHNGNYKASDDGVYAYRSVTALVEVSLPYYGTTHGGVDYVIDLDNGVPFIRVFRGGNGEYDGKIKPNVNSAPNIDLNVTG